MSSVNLVFPNQLFEQSPLPQESVWYITEESLFFNHYNFHKQKLIFHRASMKFYERFLQKNELAVEYVSADGENSDVRTLIKYLASQGVDVIHYIDPVDDWLGRRVVSAAGNCGINLKQYTNPGFLLNAGELKDYFSDKETSFFQADFYKSQRKRYQILVDEKMKPTGGKWSFDKENRKKYPSDKEPPKIKWPDSSSYWKDATEYVDSVYFENYGQSSTEFIYPHTFSQAKEWFRDFLENRFDEFGTYEDAIVSSENLLNHSLLSPLINSGLLSVEHVLEELIEYASENDIPINSYEGFVRQLIGWREFIRGIYIYKGRRERTHNFWGFTRKIPLSFYGGSTGIPPVDQTIKKVLRTGYCHHIERLMILGNFMLLCEFDPDEVYHWFMELFIDSYDWVMVPNVYGMSQFADGGLMATKPYISGSNYILKMSDFSKGTWTSIWDGLFWNFMHKQRSFFEGNPRLSMLLGTWDQMSEEKRSAHLTNASQYLKSLDA